MVQLETTRPPTCTEFRDDLPVDKRPALPRDVRIGFVDTLLVVALGVLLVAVAYARARAELDFATPMFWTGQLVLFSYVAFRVLEPSTSARDRECVVLLYAVAQSAIRWAYSPHMFTFYDELQQLRSLVNVLNTGEHFHTNYNLPISPRYPGMQNIAAEVAQVSSASPFLSGVVVAGASHLLLAVCVLLLIREVTGSSRIACVGVLVYMLNPHAQYFNTSFHYETVALPFVVLALFFSVRFATRQQARFQSFIAVLVCITIVVMTHHVSAFAVLGLLGVVMAGTLWFRDTRRLALPFALCGVAGAFIVGVWIAYVAPVTLDYLGGPVEQALDGLARLWQVEGKVGLPGPPAPLVDRIFIPASVALTLGILVVGVRSAHRLPPLERCFIWIAVTSYGVVLGTRLLITNGAEWSARMLTFTALFTSVAIGGVLMRLARNRGCVGRLLAGANKGLASATALLVMLFVGSVGTNLPEWWQRLPGRFWIAGFASGVDSVGISKAEWAAARLQPGARFFGDVTSLTVLSTLAELDPIRNPERIYYNEAFTPEDYAHIKAQSAVYVDVDMRMAEQPPVTGRYFPEDVNERMGRSAMAAAALTKFDNIAGISRIYDSGYSRFFDLRWVREPDR